MSDVVGVGERGVPHLELVPKHNALVLNLWVNTSSMSVWPLATTAWLCYLGVVSKAGDAICASWSKATEAAQAFSNLVLRLKPKATNKRVRVAEAGTTATLPR